MKRKVIVGLLLCMMCTLYGCGTIHADDAPNKDSVVQDTDKNNDKNTEENNDKNTEELSIEMLKNAKETPTEEFDYLVYEGNVYLNGYLGQSDVIIIPDEIEGYPVVDVGDGSFRNNANVKAIRFGANVKRIGASAFGNCTSLEYILFGKNVEEVGDYAFSGNPNVKEFILNEGLLKVGKLAICEAEIPVIIPKSVVEIGESGFRQPVKAYAGTYGEQYLVNYAANFSDEFVYEIIE